MKYNWIGYVLLVTMLMSPNAFAQEASEESGFFGNIILGGGWMGGRPSQNEVVKMMWGGDPKNRKIDSLEDRANRHSYGIPVLRGEIGYAFAATGTEIKTNLESVYGRFNLELSQYLGDYGAISLTGTYHQDDVWKHPFLVGVARQTTTATETGIEIEYTEIFGSGFQLSYGYEDLDIKDDVIGDLNRDLRRSGQVHTIGAGYAVPFNQRNVWIPKLEAIIGDMDGESNSFKGAGASVEHFGGMGRFIFVTSLGYKGLDYNKTHDVFDKTRKDQTLEFSEFITYVEPFGWKSWALHGLFVCSDTNSNITFYDHREIILGMGFGYSF